jgi:hypothetical protein
METQKQLTEYEKRQIWDIINENRQPDDREPLEVIEQNFLNEDEYLLTMGIYLGLPWLRSRLGI